MTAPAAAPVRDDRVLAYTRGLSVFIAPFLIVAFTLLYLFGSHVAGLFAWNIAPSMSAMVLASAYLGGFYYFLRVPFARRWAAVKLGLPPVILFASLLGVATIMHWGKFSHEKVGFWLWAGLYFTAPFLVAGAWVANRRHAADPLPDEVRVGRATRWAIGVVGLLGALTGVAMFLAPQQMIPLWPWPLTPLTCRVIGSVFALGIAAVGVLRDPRWLCLRLMVQVAAVMITAMLVAALRARHQMILDRPLTPVMAAGFVVVLVGLGLLWYQQEVAPRRR